MKQILTFIFILSCFVAYGQGGWVKPNNTYGSIYNRGAFDSSLTFPAWWGGTPVNGDKAALRAYDRGMPAIIGDTAAKIAYIYWPKDSSYQAIGSSSGSGTVTTFSAGDLGPLFTTNVANGTTTPALTFSLSNAPSGTLFGRQNGTAGAPSYLNIDSIFGAYNAPVSGVNEYTVEDSTNVPPVSFPVGVTTTYWLVGGAPTGDFTGLDYNIVVYESGVVSDTIVPNNGDYAVTLDDGVNHRYDGATWPVTYTRSWNQTGNVQGGFLGSTGKNRTDFIYNNVIKFRVGGNVVFPQHSGTNNAFAQLTSTGILIRSEPAVSYDTTTVKPIGTSADGTPYRMAYWPGSGGSGLSGLQANLTYDPVLTTDNTITGTGLSYTHNTARFTIGLSDSMRIATTNSFSVSSLAGLNLWAVGTLTERATAVTVSSASTAFFGSVTTADSTGWHTQLAGGRIGTFWLGATAIGATTFTDSIMTYNATTKKINYVSPNLLQYFTRVPTSGGTGRIYPTINVADTFQLGYSGASAGAKFYNAGTSRLDGAIGFGGSGVSSTVTLSGSTSTATGNYSGIFMNLTANSNAENISIRGGINNGSGSGSSTVNIGVYGYSSTNASGSISGALIGVRGEAMSSLSASGNVPVMKAVSARVQLGNSNNAAAIPINTYAIYTESLFNNSVTADSVRYYRALYIDSSASNLISSGFNWGIYQKGTNAINFISGKTRFGYSSTGDTIPTMQLQMGAGRFGMSKGADVASANDLTLGSDGNMFHITGTTQINAITTANWQAGSEVTLIFDASVTVKNNTAGGAGTAVLRLAGAADFSATALDALKLGYDGTQWYELSRSVN